MQGDGERALQALVTEVAGDLGAAADPGTALCAVRCSIRCCCLGPEDAQIGGRQWAICKGVWGSRGPRVSIRGWACLVSDQRATWLTKYLVADSGS